MIFLAVLMLFSFLSCSNGPQIVVIPVNCHPQTEATMGFAGFEEELGDYNYSFPVRKTSGIENPEKITKIFIEVCENPVPPDKK